MDRRTGAQLSVLVDSGTHLRAVARERQRRATVARRRRVAAAVMQVQRLETEAQRLADAGRLAAAERMQVRAEVLRVDIAGGR